MNLAFGLEYFLPAKFRVFISEVPTVSNFKFAPGPRLPIQTVFLEAKRLVQALRARMALHRPITQNFSTHQLDSRHYPWPLPLWVNIFNIKRLFSRILRPDFLN